MPIIILTLVLLWNLTFIYLFIFISTNLFWVIIYIQHYCTVHNGVELLKTVMQNGVGLNIVTQCR